MNWTTDFGIFWSFSRNFRIKDALVPQL
jgi:hypothetical protein